MSYTKNFLTKVIFRIDFDPIDRLGQELDSAFSAEISEFLITGAQEKILTIKTDMPQKQHDQASTVIEKEQYKWNFSLKDNPINISFAPNFLWIQTTKYECFADFKRFILKFTEIFFRFYPEIRITRLGLRYINEIRLSEGTPFQNEKYITAAITEPERNFFEKKFPGTLCRSMSQTTLNFKTYTLIANYGYYNSEFPSPMLKNEYILDFDYSTRESDKTTFSIYLDNFNTEAEKLFESCIENDLRTIMLKE